MDTTDPVRVSGVEHRADSRQGFMLHAWPWRETSLLVDVLARGAGRMTLVARGARRPRSALRGVLRAFQPLIVGWAGKGEVRNLTRAEWAGGQPLLAGEALLCGFYANELLLRLLPREDPHDALYDRYAKALASLARGEPSAPILRGFEKALLAELGYALSLENDAATGRPIDPGARYVYDSERGPLPANGSAEHTIVSGRTLLDIARDDFSDAVTLAQAKTLMRSLINHRLEYRPLQSRRIFRELMEL